MDKYEFVKRLEYCAENKCDICQEENGSGFPWIDGWCYGFTERLYDAIALLKAQEPIEARLHLCESCTKEFPECEATVDDIEFGCGVGNDNIIGCLAYVNRWKTQEPRVMTLEEAKSTSGYVIVQSRSCNIFELQLIKDGFVYDSFAVPIAVDDLWWEGYNKHWRLWTSVPTDEQRETTPWK